VDSLQPTVAVQEAFEQVSAAEALGPLPLEVGDGVIHARQQLEAARRSPGSADFGRLRSMLRERALGPASRVALRNATRLQDEIEAWLKLQLVIGDHLRAMNAVVGESLRESQK
jgi:hypothetical protein